MKDIGEDERFVELKKDGTETSIELDGKENRGSRRQLICRSSSLEKGARAGYRSTNGGDKRRGGRE